MKISFGVILIIVLVLLIASILSFFWVVLTPRWSFTVTTDKTSYTSTDDIRFTVTLKNTGYISQTITSGITQPVAVWIEVTAENGWWNPAVWDNGRPPNHLEPANTVFTILAGNVLTRTFEFNQSLIAQGYKSGPYTIRIDAVIPKADTPDSSYFMEQEHQLFYAYTQVTATPS